MPMLNTRMGSAIAATIRSFKPNPGEKITDAQLELMWQAVAQDIIDEVNNHADIELDGGEIPVPGAGLIDSTSGPVTGSAVNGPTTISGKIK